MKLSITVKLILSAKNKHNEYERYKTYNKEDNNDFTSILDDLIT